MKTGTGSGFSVHKDPKQISFELFRVLILLWWNVECR